MAVTITELRKNLFQLTDRALAGERVEFVHRGQRVRLTPVAPLSRLQKITPLQITNPDMTAHQHRAAERKLRTEMWAEIEKDWAEI